MSFPLAGINSLLYYLVLYLIARLLLIHDSSLLQDAYDHLQGSALAALLQTALTSTAYVPPALCLLTAPAANSHSHGTGYAMMEVLHLFHLILPCTTAATPLSISPSTNHR